MPDDFDVIVIGGAEAVTGRIDADAALAQRDYMTADWDDAGQRSWVEGKGIELVRGVGALAGERAVEVALREGSARRWLHLLEAYGC